MEYPEIPADMPYEEVTWSIIQARLNARSSHAL